MPSLCLKIDKPRLRRACYYSLSMAVRDWHEICLLLLIMSLPPAATAAKVLVIDDDKDLRYSLRRALAGVKPSLRPGADIGAGRILDDLQLAATRRGRLDLGA